MFYVTDDGYVLSVKSEESKNRYTGSAVDDMINYIKRAKQEPDGKIAVWFFWLQVSSLGGLVVSSLKKRKNTCSTLKKVV